MFAYGFTVAYILDSELRNDGDDDINNDGTTVDDTIGAAAPAPAQKAVDPNAIGAAAVAAAVDPAQKAVEPNTAGAAVAAAAVAVVAAAAGNIHVILCPLMNCYFIFHAQ